MLPRRTLAAVSLTALLAALVLPDAGAATPGVGVSSGGTELLHVAVGGGVLDLRLLGESSTSTNQSDPGAATERVAPLTVSSTAIPALGALTVPPVEVTSTDGEQSTATPGIDLGSLAGTSVVPGVLDGTIDPVTLRAVVDSATALAGAAGGATDLAVLGGVLQVDGIAIQLGSGADTAQAGAFRGVSIDSIEILDLAAVLQLLGLNPADLPLDVAAALLETLGIALPDGLSADELVATVDGLLGQAGTIPEQIAALDDQVDALVADASDLEAQLAQLLPLASSCSPLDPVLILLGITCAQVPATISSLQSQLATIDAQIDALLAQIDALLDQIAGLLDQILALVDGVLDGILGAPLVVIEDIAVTVGALAAETVEASSANVAATVGAVRIGTIELPGVDAIATLDQLAAIGDQLTSTVGGVLGLIDPALAGLVDIDLFERTTSVTGDSSGTVAEALLTGLRVQVTPPDLCALLTRLGAEETIAGLLDGLSQSVPALPLPVADVLSDLGSILTCTTTSGALVAAQLVGGLAPALTEPLTLEALTVAGRGAFAAVPTQVPPTTTPGGNPALPRTGGDPLLLVFGSLAAVAALGLRRVAARATR